MKPCVPGVVALIIVGITACSSPAPSGTAAPFMSLEKLSEDEFLFISIDDNDSTCLSNLCDCPVSEAPPPTFEFSDGILYLNELDFDKTPEDWITFRHTNNATVLYSYWSLWSAELRLFSALPVSTPSGNFILTGVDSQGQIQVEFEQGSKVVPVGSVLVSEAPEQKGISCRVLHKYSLINHGLIKDENVKFFRERN